MRESPIEKKLVEMMEDMGGEAYKFTSSNNRGMPDRMCVFPSGKIVFVELKAPGRKLAELQKKKRKRLTELNQLCIKVDMMSKVYSFINIAKTRGWFNYE